MTGVQTCALPISNPIAGLRLVHVRVVEVCHPRTGKERVRNGQRTGGERTNNGPVRSERISDMSPYHRNGSRPADTVICPFQPVLCPFPPRSYARSGTFPGPRAQERELIFFSSRSRSVPVTNQFPFQMGPSLLSCALSYCLTALDSTFCILLTIISTDSTLVSTDFSAMSPTGACTFCPYIK